MPNNYETVPEMVSLKEAERRLNEAGIPVKYQTLRKLCSEKKLPHVRLARNYYLNWSAILEGFREGAVYR